MQEFLTTNYFLVGQSDSGVRSLQSCTFISVNSLNQFQFNGPAALKIFGAIQFRYLTLKGKKIERIEH